MTLINELVAIEAFIKRTFPTAITEKQTVPKVPKVNTFVIRLQNDERTLETPAHYRIEREYQIVYFGAKSPDVLAAMDALSTAVYQSNTIPMNDGSLRYVRTESFSFSMPFETDGGLYAAIGVLSAETREARTQAVYDKIMKINTRYQ